jgi:hypothetical protein
VTADGNLDFSALTRDQTAALAEMTTIELPDGTRRVKFRLCARPNSPKSTSTSNRTHAWGRPRQIEHAEIGEGQCTPNRRSARRGRPASLSPFRISKAEELLGIPRNLHETIKSTGQTLALPIA